MAPFLFLFPFRKVIKEFFYNPNLFIFDAMIDQETLDRLNKAREKKPPKVKNPLRKVAIKKLAEKDKEKQLAAEDAAFYKEIWAAWPHRCFECNDKLGSIPSNYMFHHLLEKNANKRPDLRHTPENIVLLCLRCHDQVRLAPGKTPKTEQRAKEIEKLFSI